MTVLTTSILPPLAQLPLLHHTTHAPSIFVVKLRTKLVIVYFTHLLFKYEKSKITRNFITESLKGKQAGIKPEVCWWTKKVGR